MFTNATQKELQWLDNGKPMGLLKVNTNISLQDEFTRPFIRNKGCEILSIGRVNYALLDTFIIQSLNDYYAKINEAKDANDRNQRIIQYNELYQLWYRVNIAKQNHDIQLNSYYDDIVYRLYLLGYHN